MRVMTLLLIASTACTESLGIDEARFYCASNDACAAGFFCDRVTNLCAERGCGDGVLDPGEECDGGDGCPLCRRELFTECDTRSSCKRLEMIDIAAGERHACGITVEGRIVCEGSNLDHLQRLVGQATPPNGSFQKIAAGIAHSCAITDLGVVDCWGADDRIFADGTIFHAGQSEEEPSGSFVEITSSSYHSCALSRDSTVTCFGANRRCQSNEPEGFVRDRVMSAVSSGYEQNCAIRDTKELVCWGGTEECGIGTLLSPPQISARALSAGWYHACAIEERGALRCWGRGAERLLDAPAGDDWQSVACGRYYCCALDSGGRPECWGDDGPEGQPFEAPDDRFQKIAAGPQYACGLRMDRTVACFGRIFETTIDE